MADLNAIAELEQSAWPAYLRASSSTLEQRLHWQHIMLGAFKAEQLVGIASWRYDQFDPTVPMPKSFDAFANRPNQDGYNAAYVYNFAITPKIRNTRHGLELALQLIAEGIKILIRDHCTYLVGASRCPSYDGSEQDHAKPSSELKIAIDTCAASKATLVDATLPWQNDPVLSFYKHALHCSYLEALPAFMPEDTASGGYAIGFYKVLGKPA